jgi:hypothetical protein
MTPDAQRLAQLLIRNWHDVPRQREERAPLYVSEGARLAPGTAARKLGATVDTVSPRRRIAPNTRAPFAAIDYWDGEP